MGSLRILFLLLSCICSGLAYDSMNDHLDEKLRQTKIEIAKLHFREDPPVETKLYKVQWDPVWQQSLDKERPFIANTFDKILLVEGNRFVTFSTNETSINRTLLSQEIISPNNNDTVRFVRNIVWKGVIYLLVCYGTGSCGIYTGTDYPQLRHRQTIQHKGHPMDASFFVRANRLYLVVAHNSGQFVVPSLIYHWRGTYMDVMAEVMTIAAVSVTTFTYKQSTIIIFAQNDEKQPDIGSTVYEFKDTSPDRIQFLPTSNPTSVHHYSHAGFHFILLMNEHGPSNLFWWDGHELLNWQQVEKIQAPSLLHIVNINDATFFIVGHANDLQLYKFENASDCALLGSMRLPAELAVIDSRVRIEKTKIIVVLVLVDEENIYSLRSFELRIEEIPSERSTKESDILSKHLAELIEMLQQRKWLVEKAEASKSLLLPANENLTLSEPMVLPNVILESGTVGNINIIVDEDDIVAPGQLAEGLERLMHQVNDALDASRRLSTISNDTARNILNADIIVTGDATIENLRIDKLNVDFINDVDTHSRNVIGSNEAREASRVLRGKDIVIQDLKIDAICGIPFHYWSLRNDSSRMMVNPGSEGIEFSNDTVHLRSNVSLTNFTTKSLNGTDFDELFRDLFIIGKNQRVTGNLTYHNGLQIQNLTVGTLNGIPMHQYMNTKTDQIFDKFVARKIRVENLYADSINGVPVSQAARLSTENVIKGEARIARLRVTNKLTVDTNFKLTEARQHQIYNNVTIDGNLKIVALDLQRYTKILQNGVEMNLNDVLDHFWTKSTDQVIENDVSFRNDLVIDQLNTKYLNGFLEEEFLYTSAARIPENFRNLHFERVRVDDTFFADGEDESFFDVAPESVTIREKLYVEHLHADHLLINIYNGLPMVDILSGKRGQTFQANASFAAIRAAQAHAQQLQFGLLNDESSAAILEAARNPRKSMKTKHRKTVDFRTKNLRVEMINDLDLRKLLMLKNINASGVRNLMIHGDLTVNGDLNIESINDRSPIEYLRDRAKENVVINKQMAFEELIVQNVSLKSLNGNDADRLFEGFLSRTKEQNVPGRFSFYKIVTQDMRTRFINDRDTTEFRWIDEPLLVTGNVTFDDLFVEGDVVADTINDRNVRELYENLLDAVVRNITNLRVDGNVSWTVPSVDGNGLTFLFENAVTKTTNQSIPGDTYFRKDVSASTVTGQWDEIRRIQETIADAVIDDGQEVIRVAGRKIFKDTLIVNSLTVTGDIAIPIVNDIDVLEFNDSVVRRRDGEAIAGSISFLDEVAINRILVDDDSHDIPLKGAALATDLLPAHVVFQELELRDAYLKNLDGVNFDEFLRDRVTVDRDHVILGDVQFNGIVHVAGNANVSRVNDIDPFDLVLNGTEETQTISGTKFFEEHVIVDGDVYASFINGVNISSEYYNGVQNDEDVEIVGDLVFEKRIKVTDNVTVSSLVNGINLRTVLDDLHDRTYRIIRTFNRNETELEDSIWQSSLIAETLRDVFFYLEREDRLRVHVPNVKRMDVVHYEQVTKLNMYGEEPGPVCGLPDNCSCPVEYVAELDKQGCRIQRMNGTRAVRNFHELHSTFGVNVITDTVSYNRECTSANNETEYITISWMKSGMIDTGDLLANVKETTVGTRGFVKDAEVFMTHGNSAFVVLAVYYDISLGTHHTNSLVYKIDLVENTISLHQTLPTDGAWVIEIFKIHHHQVYLLLGCFGDAEKSFLYKLDTTSSKFAPLRTFGGKTRNARSLFQEQDYFVLLDDFDTNAVNIFEYEAEFDNFYEYQSLFHDSRINSVECFYADEPGHGDTFIIVVTENNQFYIYEYMYAQKFQLKIRYWMDDVQTMVPFHYADNHYIFTGTGTNSTILRIVKQGPH